MMCDNKKVFTNPMSSVSQLFDSKNSFLHVKSTFLHRFPSTELTVPKNLREYCLQTLQFHNTHGDSVCKPYQFSQFSQSVSCSILGRRMWGKREIERENVMGEARESGGERM